MQFYFCHAELRFATMRKSSQFLQDNIKDNQTCKESYSGHKNLQFLMGFGLTDAIFVIKSLHHFTIN